MDPWYTTAPFWSRSVPLTVTSTPALAVEPAVGAPPGGRWYSVNSTVSVLGPRFGAFRSAPVTSRVVVPGDTWRPAISISSAPVWAYANAVSRYGGGTHSA
ncbi:MAG: hypothetical protein HOU01_22845 [Streptomycetaceae bacterium]|jgi:hypothetical protein|nr:hypothetical protein [Streptomycetaceae bacterium]